MVWLWIALAAVLAAALLLLGAAVFFFKFSIRRYRKERADEQYEEADSIWNPFAPRMKEAQAYIRAHTREKVKLTSFDGLELAALYLPVERPRGTVIAFHGYRSLATIDFALEVEFLHRLGYDVVLPYQRSHGESQGKYITYGVKERFDCQSWARYAARRWGDRSLFLMGISMGAATVLMASGLELPPNTRGIVADCGFTTPWDIMAHVARRDYKLPRALFLHGEKDDFVPVSMTEENYHACASPKALRLVPGAEHAQSFGVDTPGCEETIQRFLEGCLG